MSRYNKLVGFFFEEFWSVFLLNMFEGREILSRDVAALEKLSPLIVDENG